MKKNLIWIIVAVGLVLRIYNLNHYPSGFTPDEASFGYDAYSLLHTGQDQWGHAWPLVLESFGDFKAPLYSYILIPFVFVFGLHEWVIRLPSALLGTAAIYVVYLLVWEMLKQVQHDKYGKQPTIAIIASFILAISPWHIMLSRGAFEANLTSFFMPLGIYLFIKGGENSKLYFWSALIFGLNMFTYHSAKVVTPLIVAFLLLSKDLKDLNLKSFIKVINNNMLFISIFSIFVLLTVYTFTLGAAARAKDINVFKGSLEEAANERTQSVLLGLNPLIARIGHSKYQIGFERFMDRYVDYFSPSFYATDGPGEATYGMFPGNGVLYVFEILFLLYFLVNYKKYSDNIYIKLLVFWLLIAPIPAALTSGVSLAANRSAIMIPALQILVSIGLYEFINRYKNYYVKPIVGGLYILFFVLYVFDYAYLAPFKFGDKMLAGNMEMARYVLDNKDKYSQIIIDKKLSEPHIYLAFVEKLDPTIFQSSTKSWDYKNRGLTWVDQLPEYDLSKYTFRAIHFTDDKKLANTLLIGRPEDFPASIRPVKTIYYPSGLAAIVIVDPAKESL